MQFQILLICLEAFSMLSLTLRFCKYICVDTSYRCEYGFKYYQHVHIMLLIYKITFNSEKHKMNGMSKPSRKLIKFETVCGLLNVQHQKQFRIVKKEMLKTDNHITNSIFSQIMWGSDKNKLKLTWKDYTIWVLLIWNKE